MWGLAVRCSSGGFSMGQKLIFINTDFTKILCHIGIVSNDKLSLLKWIKSKTFITQMNQIQNTVAKWSACNTTWAPVPRSQQHLRENRTTTALRRWTCEHYYFIHRTSQVQTTVISHSANLTKENTLEVTQNLSKYVTSLKTGLNWVRTFPVVTLSQLCCCV